MMTQRTLLFAAIAVATTSYLNAGEYSRYALDSVTITDGLDNNRNLDVGGTNVDLLDNENNIIPASFALAPFQFHPRDFSLSQVETINSISLGIRNGLSDFTDDGAVEVFYVPDSRDDFGVPVTEDDEADPCDFGSPHFCYDELTYDNSLSNGIVGSQFSAAPVSLGQIDVTAVSPPLFGDPVLEDFVKMTVDLDAGAAAGMVDRINSGQGFHLLFGALDDDTYIKLGSFNGNRDDGPGGDVRPQLIIDASGVDAGVTKDLRHHGAIHVDGDDLNGDFYGSGNDDVFSEYGIANFQFSKEDFGVESVTEIGSVELTLHHNERGFSDGEVVEFFFAADTADGLNFDPELGYQDLTYNAELENGLDESQYSSAPVSLGTYAYEPKFGGNSETFDLQLPDDVKATLAGAIDSGDDFHIIIAAANPEDDITFSGSNAAFDPGNPQLTISLGTVDPGNPLDLNGDGNVDVEDAALVCSSGQDLDLLGGDTDFNGSVDFADFLTLSGNFGQAGDFSQGDFDCSGMVDFADFLTLSGNFGTEAGGAESVPEPNAGVLMLLAVGALVGVRRRRS